MNSLTAQIMVNILNWEMKMPKDSVWLRDQNRLITNDYGLYIVVGMINTPTIYGNVVYMTEIDGVPYQINELQTREIIQVDILSRSNDALTRNVEIPMAMASFYAQQQQELNNFKIFPKPLSFANTSEAEGGSTLNRYSLTFAAMIWYRKQSLLNSPFGDYYDDFTTRADDEKTIGTNTPLLEFEITPDTPPPP